MTPRPADSCNRLVGTTGRDGFLRVWDLKKRSLRAEVRVGLPILRICHHAGTGLMAAACEDNVIRMYDLEVRGGTVTPVLGLVGQLQISTTCKPANGWQRACRRLVVWA